MKFYNFNQLNLINFYFELICISICILIKFMEIKILYKSIFIRIKISSFNELNLTDDRPLSYNTAAINRPQNHKTHETHTKKRRRAQGESFKEKN